jgi:8-oxo-dGTP diphosphatase
LKSIRNSAKAIIIKDGKMLFTKNKDDLGFFYLLPGGGQEHGETLREALQRECLEEIGQEVEIGDIKFIREYIGKKHEFAKEDSDVHQIEYMFICKLEYSGEVQNGLNPDDDQVGVEWIELERIEEYRIYPKHITNVISKNGELSELVYIGAVN